ncbi:hypothetical protein BDZ90DRAFT_221398 [Jaminaea rosea]|uniref:Uncharacterized protein n=1 Tax=Jaminaea rosea TaxID=1569628 RepID=A0A316UN95_9BASI|nr:hypothetical protein BDZ90DRAFT_221398 [Jaminaea rosea]PWN26749.1 hypothetical protein BDZ90DRAFT_221398 [Jaminaea rosea]
MLFSPPQPGQEPAPPSPASTARPDRGFVFSFGKNGGTAPSKPSPKGGILSLPHFSLLQSLQAEEQAKLKLSKVDFFRDAIRIRHSVLPQILPSVLGITLWSALIFSADAFYGRQWKTSSTIVQPLSIVVGLLLVFRTGTCFEKWNEARKVWAQAEAEGRSLGRWIWLNADISVYARRLRKKTRAIRLLSLFFTALAHELREEYGVGYPDYEGVLSEEDCHRWESSCAVLQPSHAAMHSTTGSGASLRQQEESSSSQAQPIMPPPSLALYSLHQLSLYLTAARASGMLDLAGPAGFNYSNTLISSLTSAHASLHRIKAAAIPAAYGIHLKQCTAAYLLALPLTLVTELGWKVIPFVTLVAVTLLGVVGINGELEVPFGDDASDHNLGLFCAAFRGEIELLVRGSEEGVGDKEEICG